MTTPRQYMEDTSQSRTLGMSDVYDDCPAPDCKNPKVEAGSSNVAIVIFNPSDGAQTVTQSRWMVQKREDDKIRLAFVADGYDDDDASVLFWCRKNSSGGFEAWKSGAGLCACVMTCTSMFYSYIFGVLQISRTLLGSSCLSPRQLVLGWGWQETQQRYPLPTRLSGVVDVSA